MITDETIREYEAQLEAEWVELDEQYHDALRQGYLPDIEKIRAEMQKITAKFEAVLELHKIVIAKLKSA